MRKQPSPLCAFAVLATGILFTGTTRAQDTTHTPAPVTNALAPIVVEASRSGRTPLELPSAVQVITGEEIAKSGYSSTAEVLEKKAGLFIRKTNSNPTLSQISMRGFGDNSFGRVLILVNGERLNNPDMAAPNLMRVPVGSISRIEVLHGPQTVLYGDFASAGVINIITDDSTVTPKTTVGASVGADDSYSAFANTTGGFANEGVTYRASADWDKSNGYRDNSDYEVYEIKAALRKTFAENRFVSLSSFYNDSEYGLPGSLPYRLYKTSPKTTTTPLDRSELDSYGLNLGGRTTIGADSYLDAHLTACRRNVDTRWIGSFGSSYYDSAIDSYAFTPMFVREAPLFGSQNILTVGADLRYDDTRFGSDFYSDYYTSLLAWDFDRASIAGYAQDEFFLTDTLSVLLGGRVEWFDNRIRNARKTTSFSTRETALEAALLYRPIETVKVYAKAGRFYHAPFIDEIFAGSGVPNLALSPETGYNVELGTEAQIAREWTASLAAYGMRMRNEIYYDPLTYQNVNSPGDTRRIGLDASLRWARDHVGSANLSYSAVESKFTDGVYDGYRMPLVPAQTLTLNGDYYLFHDLAVMGGVRYVTRQYLGSDFKNQAEPLKAYALFDCGVRYEPSFLNGLRVTFGVDNLFDKAYCDYAGYFSGYSYYYPAQGRFWKLGASYTF